MVAGFIVSAVGAVLYVAPLFIAIHRDHPQTVPIGVVDVLLGWTLVGWVAALVWALTTPGARLGDSPMPVRMTDTTDPVGQLERLNELHELGKLTDDEYASAKAKLLGA